MCLGPFVFIGVQANWPKVKSPVASGVPRRRELYAEAHPSLQRLQSSTGSITGFGEVGCRRPMVSGSVARIVHDFEIWKHKLIREDVSQ